MRPQIRLECYFIGFLGPEYIIILTLSCFEPRFEPFWLSIFSIEKYKLVNMFQIFKFLWSQEFKIDWIETRYI